MGANTITTIYAQQTLLSTYIRDTNHYTFYQRHLLSGLVYVHEYTQGQNEEYLLSRSVY